MKRIDPAKVPDVFRRLNLTPISGAFVGNIDNRECCPWTALYCDTRGCQDPKECLAAIEAMSEECSAIDFIQEHLGHEGAYAEGLMDGWDDPDGRTMDGFEFEAGFLAGREDAAAARMAVEADGFTIAKIKDDDDDEDPDAHQWDDEDEFDDDDELDDDDEFDDEDD